MVELDVRDDGNLGIETQERTVGLIGLDGHPLPRAHPGVRANHTKGAVFEGMFTPAQGADALSSAVFLKGAPTPLVIRFSNSGGVPDAPDRTRTIAQASRAREVRPVSAIREGVRKAPLSGGGRSPRPAPAGSPRR